MSTRDKYSKAISYLRKHPKEIEYAWQRPLAHKAGCLFGFAGNGKDNFKDENGRGVGCLTMIVNGSKGYNEKLEKEIRNDKNIPIYTKEIKISDLKHFARWQRKLDKEIPGRMP